MGKINLIIRKDKNTFFSYLSIMSIIISGIIIGGSYSADCFLQENPIILITGFEPFSIYEENPSQLIVESLNGSVINNATIIGIVLPVNFTLSKEKIIRAINNYHPILLISLGLNGRAKSIQIENFGLNLRIRSRSDPLWFIPKKLDPNGPMIRRVTLPTFRVVSAIRNRDIPVRQSLYAGTYVCNSVLYNALSLFNSSSTPCGFFHVPLLDYQDPFGMNLSVLINGVRAGVQASLS